MSPVENGRVRNIKMTHKLGKIAVRRGQQQMEMVGHQNVGKDRDVVDPRRQSQFFQKDLAIAPAPKNSPPFISPAGHMIKSARVLYPQCSGHVVRLPNQSDLSTIKI
jgi:hypothetical protein